jgi:lectin, mannose-binding 1
MVKNGESAVGDSSIYTVGKFDGLALTIDPHGGRVSSFPGSRALMIDLNN